MLKNIYISPPIKMEDSRIPILYGSETFTAQEISERIWRKAKILGFVGPVQAMDDYPIVNLVQERFIIFVCSTTGNGDEPENMKKFWRFLLKKNLPHNSLQNLKFGVLGLGDSSYVKFNFVAKKLHKRLIQLGGENLVEAGLSDYQHDLGHEGTLDSWLKGFWGRLKPYFPHINLDKLNNQFTFIPRWKISLDHNINSEFEEDSLIVQDIYFRSTSKDKLMDPLKLKVVSNNRTTNENHFQDVRLITFMQADETAMKYEPGDVLNMRPRNLKENIQELFSIFRQHNIDIKSNDRIVVEQLYSGM